MKKFVLLIVLMLFGCAMPPKEPRILFHADKSFSEYERKCLQAGSDQWTEQTSGLADAVYVYDYDSSDATQVARFALFHRVVRWTSDMPIVKFNDALINDGDEDGASQILGQTRSSTNDAFHRPIEMRLVVDRLSDENMCKQVVVHELGHAFGVPHINYWPAIMYPSADIRRGTCLKKADLLAFCYLNDCGSVKMNPCPDGENLGDE